MIKRIFRIFILLFISSSAYASNIEYVSGNISYSYISGGCPFAKFEITVNIFTKQNTTGDSIFVYFGDGTHGYIQRVANPDFIGNQIIRSTYKKMHTYDCGIYNISYIDTISNFPIKNLGTNDSSFFFLSADLVLNPFYPPNDSYLQFNAPTLKISKNQNFNFNTISVANAFMYDSIIHSFATNLNAYDLYLPSGVKINRTSGEIQWFNPDTLGSYTFIINTKMYKYGYDIASSTHYYTFEVVTQSPSYVYDSISSIPVSVNNFKEIVYVAGNTYSFSIVYNDLVADSIKLIPFSIDFFVTSPSINIVKNSSQKNTLFFSWSPQISDERGYPYNFVLQSISYYPNDSISNSYQTVSFVSGIYSGINESNSLKHNTTIYPSPTNSILNITDENHQFQNTTIEIKNYLGQIVYSFPFVNQIDVSGLSSGMYFLSLRDKNNLCTMKFVKE